MGKLSTSTYTQTTVTTATQPSTSSTFNIKVNAPLVREIVRESYVYEPALQQVMDAGRSFFRGDEIVDSPILLENLKRGQQIRVNVKKDQNPFGLYQKSTLSYETVDTCHNQLQLDCAVPCINTLPTFQNIVFAFDMEYAWGVRACDADTDFWDFDLFTEQYALSRRAEQFGREVDMWNTVIRGLIAAPATTVDVVLAAKHATHYWEDCGTITANGRSIITEAYWYMVTNFQDVTPYVFMPVEAANELVKSVENPYNLNQSTTRVNTFQDWEVPGFIISSAVMEILGTVKNVLIMKRSPWMTTGTTGAFVSQYPLWSDDATSQYVAILDPRVGFQFAKDGYHLTIEPYDCDKLVRGMIDTEYVGSGITFPQYGMVLEFTPYTYA